MVKALLQGMPFRHPVHPSLVHFPIGLFMLSFLIDLLGLLVSDNTFVRAAYYAIAGGIGMGLLAVIPGLVDYFDIRSDHPAKRIATRHMLLNFAVLGMFGANFGLRSAASDLTRIETFPLLLSIAGVATVMYSGYLGGTMVYNDGIGVGRHRRPADTPDRTITAKDGTDFVTVAPLDQLEDGSTLRAEIDGHVLAIARVGREVYAFQEFCTHRFGPLSEGKIEGHETMCPWHRSCFDMRTGKVTEGPAKIDLKTYEVKIEAGQIQVCVGSD